VTGPFTTEPDSDALGATAVTASGTLDGGGGDVTGVVDALVMDVDVDAVAVAGVPSDPPQAARDTITTAAKGNRDQPTMDSTFVKVVVKVAIWVTLHEKSRLYPDTVATRPTIAWR